MNHYIRTRCKAMVVGVNAYDNLTPLTNAIADASAIGDKLVALGYILAPKLLDETIYTIDAELDNFCKDLGNYDCAIFYFAGHGLEIGGKNYLCLKDTQNTGNKETTIRTSLELQEVVKKLHDTGCKMVVCIIDACRNNPFPDNNRGWATTTLAPVFTPKGTMIAYSTSPGETASDGVDGHSIYTKALLHYLDEENLEVEMFFKKVRSMVYSLSAQQQTSWEHTCLIGEFSFNSGKIVSVTELGYSMNAICDKDYPIEQDSILYEIITQFKIYTYGNQEYALSLFEKLNNNQLSFDQLFIIGRNILQAANGNSFACQGFIRDSKRFEPYFKEGVNHILNGMLFEVYFDGDGHFRGCECKTDLLPDLLRLCTLEANKESVNFIKKALLPHNRRIMFIPDYNPKTVELVLDVENTVINYFWTDNLEVSKIKSIQYDGVELLTDDENDIIETKNEVYTKEQFMKLLCKHFVIPEGKLKFIYKGDIEKRVYLTKALVKTLK